jgi:hypothetical protein
MACQMAHNPMLAKILAKCPPLACEMTHPKVIDLLAYEMTHNDQSIHLAYGMTNMIKYRLAQMLSIGL